MAISDAVERTDEHHIEKHALFLEINKKRNPIDILLIGDSITRRWEDNPEIFNRFFSKYNTINFGVGGDCIENLRWRILNGELDNIKPRLVVLHIGTNNLPTNSAEEVCKGIKDILKIFRDKLPESRILLIGLLPRNKDETGRDYMSMIKTINEKLKNAVADYNTEFTDLGNYFKETSSSVKEDLLPDGLHPAEKGFTVLGDLLIPCIEKLML
jgi:platelet-activating factor acetylhydrolase IB subunit beta/gamma